MNRLLLPLSIASVIALTTLASCLQTRGRDVQVLRGGNTLAPTASTGLGSQAHYDRVMTSAFCAECHPAIYAEHELNTHGRAYTDNEVRLATGNFRTANCIRCHTPRPIFETGVGNNPRRRHFGLEDGNSCMTCHWQQDTDYSRFVGGADCKTAFHPDVGTVDACASCHKNHGTPYQWEKSPEGKLAGRTCVSCHMKRVTRPVAVGGPVRRVYSHAFPGARDVDHVRSAYEYEAEIDGNEAVVVIANTGAGHNFPTELRQRSVESLVIVQDQDGNEVARSRKVFRDPYKRPYGMTLQTNTQIISGEEREHRVPIGVRNGTVICELHYKFYFPIEDNHPELANRLERRTLVFTDIEPNDAEVETDPYADVKTPEGISPEQASPSDLPELSEFVRGTVTFEIPEGDTQADIDAGAILNTATADGTDPNGDPVSDANDSTVTFNQNPALDIVKSNGATGDELPGQLITYTFDVTNTGNVTLDNVAVGADAVLGEVDGAFPVLDAVLDRARAGLSAEMMGTAGQAWDLPDPFLRRSIVGEDDVDGDLDLTTRGLRRCAELASRLSRRSMSASSLCSSESSMATWLHWSTLPQGPGRSVGQL